MLRHNLDVSDGLHNGARGVIAQIGEPEPVNASANIRPVTRNSIGEPKILPSVPTVYIHFHNQSKRLMELRFKGKRRSKSIQLPSPSTLMTIQVKRTQLPLMLAFAMTIHKA